MLRRAFLVLLFLASSASAQDNARRVFVIHSGLHTILSDPFPNLAAETIRDCLLKRGIAEKNVIVLENPFPVANWKTIFPKDSLTMFLESMLPDSRTSTECYLRLHQTLKQREVKQEDRLIWIGHSAGGQMGLTMAHLARSLGQYPVLAKAAAPYQFDMVIALGSPVGSNRLPEDVKLRYYFSPEDKVVRWAAVYGTFALRLAGYKTRLMEFPPNLNRNTLVRIFQEIEHPYWDDDRVVDRILREFQVGYRPLWQTNPLQTVPGHALARLMCQVLEEECHIALEDPPLTKTKNMAEE